KSDEAMLAPQRVEPAGFASKIIDPMRQRNAGRDQLDLKNRAAVVSGGSGIVAGDSEIVSDRAAVVSGGSGIASDRAGLVPGNSSEVSAALAEAAVGPDLRVYVLGVWLLGSMIAMILLVTGLGLH